MGKRLCIRGGGGLSKRGWTDRTSPHPLPFGFPSRAVRELAWVRVERPFGSLRGSQRGVTSAPRCWCSFSRNPSRSPPPRPRTCTPLLCSPSSTSPRLPPPPLLQRGFSPLHEAAAKGHAPVVAALLADPRVEVNIKGNVRQGHSKGREDAAGVFHFNTWLGSNESPLLLLF